MRATMMYSALALSLIISGCSPSLISVKGSPAAPSAESSPAFSCGRLRRSRARTCAPFSFATPNPEPALPVVKGDQCPGYALCLDERNRAALFAGIDALENDGVYMRDFYQGQIATYLASHTQ